MSVLVLTIAIATAFALIHLKGGYAKELLVVYASTLVVMLFLTSILAAVHQLPILPALMGVVVGGLLVVTPPIRTIVFNFGIPLGLFIRIFIIRITAILTFPIQGLSYFAENCQEALVVIDCRHKPQVLPDASDVTQLLDIAHIWQASSLHHRQSSERLAAKCFLTVFIVLPAMLYRVNIKANAWIWGTLAYALSPRRWGHDGAERGKLGNLANTIVQGLILILAISLLAILGKDLLPKPYADLLRSSAGEWIRPFIDALIDIPFDSVRYAALSILFFSLVWLLFQAFTFGNPNVGVLTNPADWAQLDEKGKVEPLRQAGLQVLIALKLTLVSAIFTVWVFAFWMITSTAWGQNRFPHAVWSWIKPYL